MNAPQPTLFIHRDGTLVEAPPDTAADDCAELRLAAGLIPALARLREAGYRFVLVSGDGKAGADARAAPARGAQRLLLRLLESQGVGIDESLVASAAAQAPCLRERSAVIGERPGDLALAVELGVRAIRCRAGDPQGWLAVADALTGGAARRARVTRATRETEIECEVDLDREAPVEIETGIGMLDHMLEQLARHGGWALRLRCRGDLRVDEHHTVEDCALTLGRALREALGDKRGIGRYGFVLPMDESQASVALDLSGRAYHKFEGRFTREQVGGLPTELVPHFFRSLGDALGAAIHVEVRGENSHHMVEACFKGVGRALRQAVRLEGGAVPSSKGTL